MLSRLLVYNGGDTTIQYSADGLAAGQIVGGADTVIEPGSDYRYACR